MLQNLQPKRHGGKTNICSTEPGVNCQENACSKMTNKMRYMGMKQQPQSDKRLKVIPRALFFKRK